MPTQFRASPVHEADVVIIGGGITAALVAEKLAELRPNWSVIVVEAGRSLFDLLMEVHYRLARCS